jgi:KDO2-lipid IV(A) lauroyltransferase
MRLQMRLFKTRSCDLRYSISNFSPYGNHGLMLILFRLLALLPLRVLHAIGAGAGWLVYWASPRYRRRLRENLAAAIPEANGVKSRALLHKAIAEPGKAALETPAIWFSSQQQIKALVSTDASWRLIEAALAQGKGLLFLAPHLGCFEVTAQYYALQRRITVMYRPPRKTILEAVMFSGRSRVNMVPVPANMTGVRALLKALKRGEAIGILPDQAPREGEGAWAEFFGRPAYTMTLAGKLLRATGAPVLFAYAERLPRGRGYRFRLEPGPAPEDGVPYELALNRALERMILRCPGQYLWGYNRYKVPQGSAPMPEDVG